MFAVLFVSSYTFCNFPYVYSIITNNGGSRHLMVGDGVCSAVGIVVNQVEGQLGYVQRVFFGI